MKINFRLLLGAIVEELRVVSSTLQEKGLKRFGRALGFAGVLVMLAYKGLYIPPQKKSTLLQAEIKRAKTVAGQAAQYKKQRDLISLACGGLPPISDRDQWLSKAVRASIDMGGLITESFAPVREQEVAGLIFQVSSLSMTLRFAQFYNWLLRVESAKPMMRVQAVTLKKIDYHGFAGATAEIATVIQQKRFP